MGMGTIETVVFNGEDVLSAKPMISLPGNTEENTGIEITPDDIKKNGTSIIGGGFDVSSLYATDEDGRPAIGALALYNISGLSSNVNFGDVIEVTSSITARVESLGFDGNNAVKSLGWTGPKKLPEGAKIRALNAWASASGPKPLILGIRTA